jgi:RNA ligase
MNLSDYGLSLVKGMIDKGMLYRYISSEGNLELYNYTPKCIYEKEWNKATLNLRGEVFERWSGKLIAKTFPKFFNFSEHNPKEKKRILRKEIYKCYEKVDGVLGIIYNYKGWKLNTRGRFKSPQAIKGFKILKQKYDLSDINKNLTLLVEIISPKFRIVVDYGKEERLVLLSAYNRNNGKELKDYRLDDISEKTGLPLVKRFDYSIKKVLDLKSELPKDFEGFVIRFKDDSRVKIKSEEYLKIAQIVENLTPLTLWKNMEYGKVRKDALIEIPEEYREKANKIRKKLEDQYKREMEKRKKVYEGLITKIMNETDLKPKEEGFRKEMGLRMRKLDKYKHSIFLFYEEKWGKLDYFIMKRIKPKGNKFRKI